MKEELRCEVVWSKAAAVASFGKVLSALTGSLGGKAGSCKEATPSLGADFRPGKGTGSVRANITRAGRFAKALRRKKRLTNLRKLLGRIAAAKIFCTGILPAIDYGASVTGMDDTEIHTLRRLAWAAACAGVASRFLTSGLLIAGDPSRRPALAPAMRWRKEVWMSNAPVLKVDPQTEIEVTKE